MRPLRLVALLLVASFAVAVSGCGDKKTIVTNADTEGIYVDVGPLLYQVQFSRYLNPRDSEDRFYLRGLPAGTPLDTGKDAVWFAIFMRVQNVTKRAHTPTTQYSIKDTQGNEYRPIPLDAKVNPFLYDAAPLGPNSVSPEPNSPAATGTIQGGMILFKLKADSIQNRPLIMSIEGGAGATATISLDL